MAGADDDSDEDGQGEGGLQAARTNHDLGSNDHVKTIVPEGEGRQLHNPVSGCEVVKDNDEALKPDNAAKAESTVQIFEMDSGKEEVESPIQVDESESRFQPGEGDDEALKIPGSFDLSGPPRAQGLGATWSDLLRRLTN